MAKVYQSVPLDEDHDRLDVMEKTVWLSGPVRDDSFFARTSRTVREYRAWLVHAILLSVSMTLFTLSLCARDAKMSDLAYTRHYSSYSPLAPVVKYEVQRFNLTPIMVSPYVGYGPDVDRAWDHIANNIGDIMITNEERIRLGLSPKSRKIVHPKTGKEGYRAGVEVFHQLHCLNLVRQALYKNEYYGNPALGGDVGDAVDAADLAGHVDHCIETIRINLMCQGDIGVFTFREYPDLVDSGIEGDWPDFETLHVCRNFEDLRTWTNENAAAFDHDV